MRKGKRRCIDCKGWFDLENDDDIGYLIKAPFKIVGWLQSKYVEGPICKSCYYKRN